MSEVQATGGLVTSPHASDRRVQPLLAAIRRNWREQGLFLAAALSVFAARLVILPGAFEMAAWTFVQSLWPFIGAWALAICCYLAWKTLQTKSVSESFRYLWSDVFTWRNAVVAIPAALAAALLMNSFSHFKSSIPSFNPYELDDLFQQVDRYLHFGVDPWRITEKAFGYGMATVVIDKAYYVWFLVFYVPMGGLIGMPDRFGVRHQFMLTFVLVWAVLGIVCATMLSSVGPIFYDRLHGGTSAFTELVVNLEAVNASWELTTMQVREVLWDAYVNDMDTVISGISAMPSIHNAMCVLLFLVARHINRWLAVGAAAFALTIFVGSVHLGWHYAIDAYVSAVGVVLLWKLAGHLTGEAARRKAKKLDAAPALA
ncbi:phosphatase PAP2 family protein [Aminobacter sp. HY435]|uniref:phosphatase PAP2 family protein n=1 Tax=Aminobacter sp. HY435 TaxID=2970917 RepID=UPI0022B97DBD|nr:phosphatase PAP2 family protein [Aminobacter sp. HY435]